MVVALKTLWQAAQVIPERNVAIGVNVKVRFFLYVLVVVSRNSSPSPPLKCQMCTPSFLVT
jgi:hypothetical protein